MIQTAKLTATIQQLAQYDVGIANFRTKYNQLPGDTNLFPNEWGSPNDLAGNNDGIIIGVGFGEVSSVWVHLSYGIGLKNIHDSDYGFFYAYDSSVTEDQCPHLKLDQDNTDVRCLNVLSHWDDPAAPIVYRYMEGPPGYGVVTPAIKPKDMMAIDLKIDDGKASTGNVFDTRWSPPVSTPICANGDVYAVENSYACTLTVKVNTANGMTIN